MDSLKEWEVEMETGLGLTMAFETIKANGMTPDTSNQAGDENFEEIRIPRNSAPVYPDSHRPQAPRQLQVLLIDDDELFRITTVKILEIAGFRATVATGGQEALDSLAAGSIPDIILLDLNMPGMDGIETLQRIRALHADLPILIVSGQPDIEDWNCFKQPHLGVVPKPFTMKEILKKINQAARIG